MKLTRTVSTATYFCCSYLLFTKLLQRCY